MKLTPLGPALLFALALAACTRAVQPEDDSDSAIKARVENALHGRKDVDIRYITVDVIDGVVTLSGVIPSHKQASVIEHVAKWTRGVDQVMDNLAVQE